MVIPVPKKISNRNAGDCKLVLFSHLLRYYGLCFSPAEIMLAGAGLDFSLHQYKVGAKICLFVLGKKYELEEMFAENIGLPLQKKVYTEKDKSRRERAECFDDMIALLQSGNPLFVTVDRYYLEYLQIPRSHMPYHAMIVIGYDDEKEQFTALDSLSEDYVFLTKETMLKAMFQTSVMKTVSQAEYFYIKKEDVSGVYSPDAKAGLVQGAEDFLGEDGALEELNEVTQFLERMIKKSIESSDVHYLNYIKHQIVLLYTIIHDQDFQHLFYRKLYLEECKDFLCKTDIKSSKIRKFNKLIDKDIMLWDELANARGFEQQFEMSQAAFLIKGFKKIYHKEKEIFEFIKSSVCV